MSYFIDSCCISAYVVDKSEPEPKYLLLKRCGKYLTGTWQMVSGGVHKNETAWQAAVREIIEETGLTPTSLYSADAVESFYMKDQDKISFVPVFVAFVDSPAQVKLSDNEHDDFEWENYEAAFEKLIWAEQKRIITHIHQNFVLKKPNPIHLIDVDQ